ncbi:hypothetical protein GUITHDRAFT_131951 [Guillardia theta CCMP2712]|uniref:Orc1-like AAA ATPase domain-containing protein n=1 Tax=Guillardia theta (strain CCMP2712) TaxID=905079 RepID=L1K331_GUITC|nr:hypothetical protein GUITHDRAFT_131951 [Guillardia theta CCMP2712]EKX54997.1 hypothetical protein GUITHDRAFT_131951 [Guillardia theta CCMP2712]|eukprot:XP_005841977.1 hypothetical protein GUITHDRAFT_131951 [Guillardia theta CCMP2712]
MALPSISLHQDRSIITETLSKTGVDVEVSFLPELCRDSLSNMMDEEDKDYDIVFLTGAGTSWDQKSFLLEDGYGMADYVDLTTIRLVIPKVPKLMIVVGQFGDEFAKILVEEGVCPVVFLFDDTIAEGSSTFSPFVQTLIAAIVDSMGKENLDVVARRSMEAFKSEHPACDNFVKLYIALRAIAPAGSLKLNQGACRLSERNGCAAMRTRQSARVHHNMAYDGRSEIMVSVLDAFDRRCTHTAALLHGPSGCGRTELMAQLSLWYLDREKVSHVLWCNCDEQSDMSHQVTSLETFFELAGGMMKLGIAGRPLADMRENEVLRALKSNKVIIVFDDWHALREEARMELACFFKKMPANVRLLISCRGYDHSLAVKHSMELLKKCNVEFLPVAVPNIKGGDAQRMFFLHMERCKYGDTHHPKIVYENPYLRTGQCSQLGDLDPEEFEALKDLCGSKLGQEGQAHVLATMMLASCASEASVNQCVTLYQDERCKDYGYSLDLNFDCLEDCEDERHQNVDRILWPALCVAHFFLTDRHRDILIRMMYAGIPLTADELATMSQDTPAAIEALNNMLFNFRLIWKTPMGLYYVIPAAIDVLQPLIFYFSNLRGAWAELVTAKHLKMLFISEKLDKAENSGESLFLLYQGYEVLLRKWFWDWDRGGIAPPGGFEASLDGRYSTIRGIPEHYTQTRDLLKQPHILAGKRDMQKVAAELLSGQLFAIGEYELSKKIMRWITLVSKK